ncbi:UNVERIFIED_CONTAM: competence protein CoiA, partial [Bacteroidetes bacterium 56_B9]
MEKRFKESKEITDAYLTYAGGEKGHLVHVDDVPNGEACGCTCPKCGSKLIAKNKGQHNQHHFAHIGKRKCEGAVES